MAFRISCGQPERNEVAALTQLASALPDSWALLTSIPRHLTGQGSKGREIDALALSPLGAVVIELKHFGGLITVTPVGEWIVGGTLLTDRSGHPQYPLQQAGKAAQTLKSALGDDFRSVYIEACAVASISSARIQFSDNSRPQPVMAMRDAVSGIETLARTTRGVSYPALQEFFNLIGREVPPALDAKWQASPAPQSPSRSPTQRTRKPSNSPRRSGNFDRNRLQKQSDSIKLWLAFALIAGSLLGWFYLTLGGPN